MIAIIDWLKYISIRTSKIHLCCTHGQFRQLSIVTTVVFFCVYDETESDTTDISLRHLYFSIIYSYININNNLEDVKFWLIRRWRSSTLMFQQLHRQEQFLNKQQEMNITIKRTVYYVCIIISQRCRLNPITSTNHSLWTATDQSNNCNSLWNVFKHISPCDFTHSFPLFGTSWTNV